MTKSPLIWILAAVSLGLALAPSPAWAHDGVGGDELAVANWMLVGAVITIVMGILAGIWAAKNGQFNNVEASKYSMLEMSEDFDQIMAEAEEAERNAAHRERELAARARKGPIAGGMES
jgi:nitrogen fixation-related uncharacterized protein